MEKIIVLKNDTSIKNIRDEYWPIIDAAVSFLKEILRENLLEIRLLGSVPHSNAIPGNSDIDFLAIIKEKVSQETATEIMRKSIELSESVTIVSKVDLDHMSQKEIKAHFEYELILRTDSISIYGNDEYTVDEYQILNTELAKLWDINIDTIIHTYKNHLLYDNLTHNEIKRYSRLTGKDLMKCFRKRVLLEHGVLERTVERIYLSLKKYIPEYSFIFDSLWDLYQFPKDDIEKIVIVIDQTEKFKDNILSIG